MPCTHILLYLFSFGAWPSVVRADRKHRKSLTASKRQREMARHSHKVPTISLYSFFFFCVVRRCGASAFALDAWSYHVVQRLCEHTQLDHRNPSKMQAITFDFIASRTETVHRHSSFLFWFASSSAITKDKAINTARNTCIYGNWRSRLCASVSAERFRFIAGTNRRQFSFGMKRVSTAPSLKCRIVELSHREYILHARQIRRDDQLFSPAPRRHSFNMASFCRCLDNKTIGR